MASEFVAQAVILCGGLGTRLRPLTNDLPKPMVLVNGRPFLQYLLEQLAAQGITRFVLLTGYLGSKLSDYFGDGAKFGWSISYSHGPIEWDTGRRIWEARIHLDNRFLLLYSDNFVQFNLLKLKKLHQELGSSISLLLAPKLRGNIKVSSNGSIQAYDKTRNGDGFDFVEVGYMIVEKGEVLREMPEYQGFPNFSFSVTLEKLAQQQRIAGLVIRDTYHSISDKDRHMLASLYLEHKKILLIDRDGTINKKAPKGEYICSWNQFEWIAETREAMINLSRSGFKFIVITNQAGIARGMIDPQALEYIHQKMIEELSNVGVEILRVYTCPDHWNDGSFMRKPEPGMFFQAAKDFNLRMDQCLYIGDDERDCHAAANAGCGMVYLSSEKKLPKLENFQNVFFHSTVLLDLVECITDLYKKWELE